MHSFWTLILLCFDAIRRWAWPNFGTPENCLASTSVTRLVDCLDKFTVPDAAFDANSYALAQPTPEESGDWTAVVTAMLDAGAGNLLSWNSTPCSDVSLPLSLRGTFLVAPFTDITLGTPRQYCALLETSLTATGTYRRGWGTMVVPAHRATCAKSGVSRARSIHLAAPHPLFDEGTPQQAAALFALTNARSLLVSGRHRAAYRHPTDCVVPSNPSSTYWKTDPTHDWVGAYVLWHERGMADIPVQDEPFNTANRAIKAWQDAHGGCPAATCAYIQMHGKADESCPTDTVFISSGLGARPLLARSPHSLSPPLRSLGKFAGVVRLAPGAARTPVARRAARGDARMERVHATGLAMRAGGDWERIWAARERRTRGGRVQHGRDGEDCKRCVRSRGAGVAGHRAVRRVGGGGEARVHRIKIAGSGTWCWLGSELLGPRANVAA